MTAEENTKNDGAEVVEEKKAAAKKPAAKKAAAKKPAAKKATAKKPAAAASATKKSAAKKPAAKKPKADSVEEALAEVEKAAAKKPAAKKTAAKKTRKSQMLKITQVKSQIGYAGSQRKVLAGLGLGRIGRTVVRIDDPCIRGMVTKVSHLVSVEEVEA